MLTILIYCKETVQYKIRPYAARQRVKYKEGGMGRQGSVYFVPNSYTYPPPGGKIQPLG